MRKWIVALLAVMMVFGTVAPAAAAVHGRRVFVQHPYTTKQTYKVNAEIRTWGYVTPKVTDFTSRTVDILIYKRTGVRTWELVKSVESTGSTLFNRRWFRNRTFYRASFSLDAAGRYRMRAKYTWEAADGTKKSRLSTYKYFRAVGVPVVVE